MMVLMGIPALAQLDMEEFTVRMVCSRNCKFSDFCSGATLAFYFIIVLLQLVKHHINNLVSSFSLCVFLKVETHQAQLSL